MLDVDWSKVEPLKLDPATTPITAELAPALGGASDLSKVQTIDLEKLPEEFRLQRLVFQAARKAFEEIRGTLHGYAASTWWPSWCRWSRSSTIPTASRFRRCFIRIRCASASCSR